jgi:hypothetical protein
MLLFLLFVLLICCITVLFNNLLYFHFLCNPDKLNSFMQFSVAKSHEK